MDLLTYKELDTGPGAPQHPGLAHRAWHGLLSITPTAVVFLLGLSLGLGAVGAQITSLPWLIVFSIVWGITLIVLMGMVVRWMTHGQGRPRTAT
ncbi:hypothetical protein ACF9IK_30905 [Kitasatospora hibisci]|uniref:hypothetical protein n=1 Tax=Kitasatospora hibisci TaxID=3369522 RepID=UPI003754E344